jgi:hypothetical protein
MKKGDVRQVKPDTHILPPWHSWVLFAFYLVIAIVFFVMLAQKTNAEFGFMEVLFSIGMAWLLALIFSWNRDLVLSNPYLGLGIGILGIIAIISALFARYSGPYTLSFATIGALGTAIYLVVFFFIGKGRAKN